MIDDSLLPFSLPSVRRKEITAAFDGGRISSDGGVMLLASAERRMGIAARLAAEITDRRHRTRVVHALADILRARILAIACGYEDADDLDHLRSDPALKIACGRLPDSGRDLCSQPTMSRCENAPSLREVIRLMRAMVALYCRSYDKPPASVTLDIDDTLVSCMAISNCRCSTRITMSAASCPSTSMTPRPLGQWRCCCEPARPHQDRRYAVICDACCAPSGSTGHIPTSPFAATATMHAQRWWSGARRMASTS